MKHFIKLVISVGLFWVSGFLYAQGSSTYKIVVNKSNPIASLSKKEVARLFLKKVTKWPHKTIAMPVDLSTRFSMRKDFSKKVLGRDTRTVKAYWQKQIFSGRAVPPLETNSEKKALLYVGEHEGGIGYVSASTPLNNYKVKVLEITDN